MAHNQEILGADPRPATDNLEQRQRRRVAPDCKSGGKPTVVQIHHGPQAQQHISSVSCFGRPLKVQQIRHFCLTDVAVLPFGRCNFSKTHARYFTSPLPETLCSEIPTGGNKLKPPTKRSGVLAKSSLSSQKGKRFKQLYPLKTTNRPNRRPVCCLCVGNRRSEVQFLVCGPPCCDQVQRIPRHNQCQACSISLNNRLVWEGKCRNSSGKADNPTVF